MNDLEMVLINALQNFTNQYDRDPDTWPEDQVQALLYAYEALDQARARFFGPGSKHVTVRLGNAPAELRYILAELSPGRWGYELANGQGVGMGYRSASLAADAAEERAGWTGPSEEMEE
jgi:hypothetical protein